jgi:RNA polymerase sigma factor (sigma-70 family)
MNPFLEQNGDLNDLELVKESLNGSRKAMETLITRHQQFLFNLALKLVREPNDAADLTQEVLIKVITKLSQFEGKSSFRTWLYRIAVNHFLAAKRNHSEKEVRSFDHLGMFISEQYNDEDLSAEEKVQYEAQVRSIRNRCMSSMLLCLDRQQRIVFILGAIFNIRSNVAARILDITPENFRQQLSRAKKELFQFMDNRCGLINPDNPCRCSKKTKGFIKEGAVDSSTKMFKLNVLQSIQSQVDEKNEALNELIEGKYLQFFRDQPYENCLVGNEVIQSLLLDPHIVQLFHLN